VDRFYGIGRDTPDIEDAAEYVSRAGGLEVEVQIPPPLGLATRMGFIYDLSHLKIRDTQTNPYLNAGGVPGQEGGWVSGLGALWVIDTRNHTFVPDKGGLYRGEIVAYGHALGSNYGFTRYRLDLRKYFKVGKEQALATQLYGWSVVGGPPFYELPKLGGGSRMRGYYEGRYRDVHYVTGQVEFRTHLFWRVGAVAFYGLGDMSSELSRIRLRSARSSYGGGLRLAFQPKQKVNLRVDFGAGPHTNGVYFGLEEAF
jgi:outer membrane protein assembly factor BamA